MPASNTIYIILGVLALWLIMISILLVRLMAHYQSLTKGVAQKNLISALNNFIAKTGQNHDALEGLRGDFLSEKKSGETHFQRLGFKRFNPFTDTGGNQSFILSLLDENGTGVVISSLHSRENTRVYAKQIERGLCADQVLSKDEVAVIKESLK